jgi:hypothetical protein
VSKRKYHFKMHVYKTKEEHAAEHRGAGMGGGGGCNSPSSLVFFSFSEAVINSKKKLRPTPRKNNTRLLSLFLSLSGGTL